MTNQEIRNPADLRKWRIELPNLYDDADLTPYEFRLLTHYVRVGHCFQSTRTIADKCRMSKSQVARARDGLEEKGFVRVERDPDRKTETLLITVIDRWSENFAKYSQVVPAGDSTSDAVPTRDKLSLPEERVSPAGTELSLPEEQRINPFKKEPIKKEPIEETTTTTEDAAAVFQHFQNEIQMLTPANSQIVQTWLEEYPSEWIIKAINEAVGNNVRKPKYVGAILDNWSKNGRGKRKPNGHTPSDYLKGQFAEFIEH